MPRKIHRTIRYAGRSYKAGQEEDMLALPPSMLAEAERRGHISGYSSGTGDEEEQEEGLSGVPIRELRTRLGRVTNAEEVRRLRTLDSRSSAAQHYDARLREMEER